MTQIHTITIIGPISTTNGQLISYNEYPIICASTKDIPGIFINEKLKDAIKNTITKMGTEHIPGAKVHIRSISQDLSITDMEFSLQEILDMWKPKKPIQSPVKKSTPKPVMILGNVNGHI